MIKYVVGVLILLSINARAAEPDSLQTFEISTAGNAFMCPYLSPMYMNMIHDVCKCEVTKTDDLVIHVFGNNTNQLNDSILIRLAYRTGYDPKIIQVKKLK